MAAWVTMRRMWLRCVVCAAVGCCCVAASGAAVPTKNAKARAGVTKVQLSPWELAEKGRETLEAIPEGNRTKADYDAALDGFRVVYHERPGDVHAPSAVYQVAELLAEQGRDLRDAKSLKAAVGQYEFLRTQYPGSSLRGMALLAEAQIEANDLGDTAAAKERYEAYLKQYPASSHADEARAGLAALGHGAARPGGSNSGLSKGDSSRESKAVPAGRTQLPEVQRAAAAALSSVATTTPGKSAAGSTLGAMPVTGGSASNDGARRGSSTPVDVELDGLTAATPGSSATVIPGPSTVGRAVARKRGAALAQVTGIRHWSTPTYTRVAIDLGDDVTYEAARVPSPDRIYFDLHGTQLARELVGKSFTVTDDGFLKKVRAAQFSNDMTRVVLDVSDVTEYSAFLLPNPYRLIIDIHGKVPGAGAKGQGGAGQDLVAGAGVGGGAETSAAVPAPRTANVVKPTTAKPVPNTVSRSTSSNEIAALSTEPGKVDATTVPTSRPISAKVQEDQGSGDRGQGSVVASGSSTAAGSAKGKKGSRDLGAGPARAAVPTADGQTSLVRALGLKIGRIVIDAGHGGHDTGTIGVDGILEKDVVLDVALRVGKMLHERLGAEVVYTRSDDTFIPLETRTAIANKAQADLFLSIHANSSSDATARGVETYYLNFTSSPDALETAARENAVSGQSIHQLSDLVKKITLRDKIDESREFASDVEQSLYGGLQRGNVGLKNRGVKKAPFVVLIGANMPSILAEISFVTNPKDADQLQQPEYRQRVADSLFKGVAKYAGGLSGVKSPGAATERASVK